MKERKKAIRDKKKAERTQQLKQTGVIQPKSEVSDHPEIEMEMEHEDEELNNQNISKILSVQKQKSEDIR